MMSDMVISICTYQSGDFEVIIKGTGREVTLSGNQKLTDEEFELINELAPACVWTRYTRKGD